MKSPSLAVRRLMARGLTVLMFGLGSSPLLAAEALLLTGYNASYIDNLPDMSANTLNAKALCGPDGVNRLVATMGIVTRRVNERFDTASISDSELQREAQATRDDLCGGEGGFQVDTHAITYASCRMTMDLPSMLMDLRLPSSKLGGSMEVVNYDDAEITRFPIEGGSGGGSVKADAGSERMNWSGPGDNKRIAGHQATRWDYSYTMRMGGGSAAAAGMSFTTVNSGHGYFAEDVPGLHVLHDFHDQFSREVDLEGGNASIYGGLMGTLVEMLDKGMPLEMNQTFTTKMGGMKMGGGRSVMSITGLRLIDLPSGFCDQVLAPANFAVVDAPLGEMGMTIEAGDQSGSDDESDSPFGALMQMMNRDQAGAGGAANPAAQPQAQPAKPAGGQVTRAQPSSAELTTDDMTQSVQLHLQALGIDPGNTDGKLDLNTQIAISQFQAEKGLPVTGEVSPQLLGILAAEVDQGR